MAAIFQHSCNRPADAEPVLFRNDSNNVSALQQARLQKQRLEEAARIQKEQLEEADAKLRSQILSKEEIEAQRDRLIRDKNLLETEKSTLETQKMGLEADKMNLETEKRALEIEKGTLECQKRILETEKENLQAELNEANRDKEDFKKQCNDMSKKLPGRRLDNSLPLSYHNAVVMIVHAGCAMAIDSGKDCGTRLHSYEYIFRHPNQVYRLEKVYGSSGGIDDPWMISRNNDKNERLCLPNGDGGEIHVEQTSGQQAQWYIGNPSNIHVGCFTIRNVRWNRTIEMPTVSKTSGGFLRSLSHNNIPDPNWVIIVLEMPNK